MYPRNNATPPPVDLGEIRALADNALQTTGASARVRTSTGWAAATGTLDCDATSGVWSYTPTQAETAGEWLIIAVYKADCAGRSRTIVFTKAADAGEVVTDTASRTASKATGFATPANVTDARDAVITQGNSAWGTATGFATPANVTDARDAIITQGNSAWGTATGFATPANVTDARDAIITQGNSAWGTAKGFAVPGSQMQLESATITAIRSGLSTYDGSDTAGTATLLARLSAAWAGDVAFGAVLLDALTEQDGETIRFTAEAVSQVSVDLGDVEIPIDEEALAEAIAPLVWANATRTLTQPAALTPTPLTGTALTMYRGSTLILPITGLGPITGRLVFTVKAPPHAQKSDDSADVQIDSDSGLLRLMSAEAEDETCGSITIDDATAGNVTIRLEAAAAAELAIFHSGSWDLKEIVDGTPVVCNLLTSGTAAVRPDTTRTVS